MAAPVVGARSADGRHRRGHARLRRARLRRAGCALPDRDDGHDGRVP